jgi:predicted transcriptional regulator
LPRNRSNPLKRKTKVVAQHTRKAITAPRANKNKHAAIPELSTADKRRAALELRIEGHSEYDIGVALGVSRGRVSQLLKEELTSIKEESAELGDELRVMELERIDRMILSWHIAAKKDPRAADVLLRWVERRHKIMPGLEISRNEMGGIGGGPIRLSATNIDITKLNERQLANLEEILRVAGPQIKLPEDEEMPALESNVHKKKHKEEEEA